MKNGNIKKNKRNKQNKQNKQNKENKNNTLREIKPDISETICQMIIDNLISNSVTIVNIKRIYSNMNQYCFDYMIEKINPYLKANFLYHDDIISKKNIVLLSTKPPTKSNTWIKIPEPQNPDFDRYDPNNAKFVALENEIKSFSNKNIDSIYSIKDSPKSQIISPGRDISQKCSSKFILKDQRLNSLSEAIELGEKINNINVNKISQIKKIKKKVIKILKNKENENEENLNKKNKKEKILVDLPSFDLPKDVYTNKYVELNNSEENNLLRLEKEKIRLQKEEQQKNEILKSKIEYLKKIKQKQKNSKEFNGATMTFDPNGKVIQIKSQKIDNIINNDFLISKPKVNDKKNYENITLNKIKKIRIGTSSKKSNNDNNSKNKKDINEKNIKIKIEYNPAGKEIDETNKFSKISIKQSKSFVPSGPNFDIINPEVGVIIENDKKMKKFGGFEYVKKYNKPSMDEFNRLVSESSQLNSSNLNSNLNSKFLSTDSLENINNSYNGYREEFNENNPLFQGAHKLTNNKKSAEYIFINENDENEYKDRFLLKNKSLNMPTIKSYDFKNKISHNYQSRNLDNNIFLTKNFNAPNLISIMNSTENEDNNEIKINNKLKFKSVKNVMIKNKSFDKYVFKWGKNNSFLPKIKIVPSNKGNNDNINSLGKESINKFNFDIVKNKNWGEDYTGKKNDYVSESNLFRRPLKNNRHLFTESSSGIIKNLRQRVPKIDIGKL